LGCSVWVDELKKSTKVVKKWLFFLIKPKWFPFGHQSYFSKFSSEKVYLLMDRLTREYKLEEGDPCSKLIETESVKRLDAMKAIVQSYDEDKDSIATGLLEVKRNADSFLSTIAPSSTERVDVTIERVECQVKEVQEQLRAQEQQVLDVWNGRRTLAEYCLQYLELEQCAKEVG